MHRYSLTKWIISPRLNKPLPVRRCKNHKFDLTWPQNSNLLFGPRTVNLLQTNRDWIKNEFCVSPSNNNRWNHFCRIIIRQQFRQVWINIPSNQRNHECMLYGIPSYRTWTCARRRLSALNHGRHSTLK